MPPKQRRYYIKKQTGPTASSSASVKNSGVMNDSNSIRINIDLGDEKKKKRRTSKKKAKDEGDDDTPLESPPEPISSRPPMRGNRDGNGALIPVPVNTISAMAGQPPPYFQGYYTNQEANLNELQRQQTAMINDLQNVLTASAATQEQIDEITQILSTLQPQQSTPQTPSVNNSPSVGENMIDDVISAFQNDVDDEDGTPLTAPQTGMGYTQPQSAMDQVINPVFDTPSPTQSVASAPGSSTGSAAGPSTSSAVDNSRIFLQGYERFSKEIDSMDNHDVHAVLVDALQFIEKGKGSKADTKKAFKNLVKFFDMKFKRITENSLTNLQNSVKNYGIGPDGKRHP